MARTPANGVAPTVEGDPPAGTGTAGRAEEPGGYTVVARRYRPQRLEDVIGQDHVVQALRNAIHQDRIAQAYLFSGTRGVGKTSMARIFAKCLNCVRGPTEDPCQVCDICRAIAVGQDIDVIEIDGASNNGVEAVRELRQNAGLRPSRGRYKIYYIDEVHMLSTGAFNALLKTLEEPPAHVKFFFATTEKNKIPITVLSRCQVYDFAGIAPEEIVASLAEICAKEGVDADSEALQAVARRATGSMRDAQSLLEQLLSSGAGRLTTELVHRTLGTAADDRVLDLLDALADRDSAAALTLLQGAADSGVQPVDLLNGLLEFLRDAMMLAAGAALAPLAVSPAMRPRLQAVVDRWSLDSILAALQILAETRGRLRGSSHGRLLVELALVRVARLEDLADLGQLIARLAAMEAGTPAPTVLKKKRTTPEPAPVELTPTPAPTGPPAAVGALQLREVQEVWDSLLEKVGPKLAGSLARVKPSAISGPNLLVIDVPAVYNWVADALDTAEVRPRIEAALGQLLGKSVPVRFVRAVPAAVETPEPTPPARPDDLAHDPMVRKVIELFEARPHFLEVEDGA